MRAGTDNLKDVLIGGSFNQAYSCDIFYGSTRTIQGLPIRTPQFKNNIDAATAATASVMVPYTPDFAESLTPVEFTDALAPFGAEATVQVEISAGSFHEVVQLGRYRITAIPKAYDEFMNFLGTSIVSGSLLELTLEDRSVLLRRWGFRVPESPPSLASCWDEIGRISGAQLSRNMPDKPIPTSIVYEASQGGRWKAIQELAGVLGGTAVFNEFGVLTLIPDEPGPVVGELKVGAQGTIIDVDYSMDSEGVYNEVVGNFEDDNRNPIYAYASVVGGRLDPTSEYKPYTYYMASPYVKTQQAADAAVKTRLFNLSSRQTYRVPVQCIYNPLIQLGDVLKLERPDRALTGRVMDYSNGADGLMTVELEVARPIL